MRNWMISILMLPLVVLNLTSSPNDLVVSGEELAWKVESDYLVVDFAPSAGVGRSGQIRTIFIKDEGVLLTRGSDSHTIHLSPNLARGGDWVGTNRWDPAPEWALDRGDGHFRLSRAGQMPLVPEVRGTCAYEILPDSRAIRVEESLEATADAEVSLLRLDEWSFVPDETNPFTHIAWAGKDMVPHLEPREGNPRLPLETAWVGFYSKGGGFGLVSVLEELRILSDAGRTPPLANAGVRFSGQPHYFYRAFIYPAGEIGEGEPDQLVKLQRGDRYSVKYHLLVFQGEGTSAETILQDVVSFHSGLSQKR